MLVTAVGHEAGIADGSADDVVNNEGAVVGVTEE